MSFKPNDMSKFLKGYQTSDALRSLEESTPSGPSGDNFTPKPFDEVYGPTGSVPPRRREQQQQPPRQRLHEEGELGDLFAAVAKLPNTIENRNAKSLVTEALVHAKGLFQALSELNKALK